MPRHEPVSPEEDLASYYGSDRGPAPPGASPNVGTAPPPVPSRSTPPPVPSSASGAVPPPIPPGLAVPPSWPADGFEPDANGASGPAPGRLAPVQRPAPSFNPPAPMVADAPNPVVAALVSFFVPGAGQIYAGQTVKGVVILLVALLTCFGGGLFNVLAAIDALLIAQRRGRGEPVGDWQFF